jgi:hypothetical protein
MRGPGSRFSAQDVETIRAMAAVGHGGVAIARKLDVSAEAIRKKCIAIGLPLRPPKKSNQLRFKIEPAVVTRLREEARRRGTTAHGLARQIVTVCVWDSLIGAVIDAPISSPIAKAGNLAMKSDRPRHSV